MQLVGVAVAGGVEDAGIVEVVDAHLTRGVDDAAAAQIDAHMHNASFGIVEKAEVVAPRVGNGGYWLTLRDLLRRVAQQSYTTGLEADLSQSRAVDTHSSTATPEVRRTEIVTQSDISRTGDLRIEN